MNESDYYCHNRDYPAGDEVLLITLADPDRWELPFLQRARISICILKTAYAGRIPCAAILTIAITTRSR
ncbi:hypothetical protein SODG_002072 [Sodalis praecaptivus]